MATCTHGSTLLLHGRVRINARATRTNWHLRGKSSYNAVSHTSDSCIQVAATCRWSSTTPSPFWVTFFNSNTPQGEFANLFKCFTSLFRILIVVYPNFNTALEVTDTKVHLSRNYVLPSWWNTSSLSVSGVKKSSADRPLSLLHSKIFLVGAVEDLDTCIIHYQLVLTTGILLGVVCCDCRSNLSSWRTRRRIGTRFSTLEVVWWWGSVEVPVWIVVHVVTVPRHHGNKVGRQCCSQRHRVLSLNRRPTARPYTATYTLSALSCPWQVTRDFMASSKDIN